MMRINWSKVKKYGGIIAVAVAAFLGLSVLLN